MDVIIFSPEVHTKVIEHWLELRGLNKDLAQDVPQIGFMAVGGMQYIACGFIRRCEGSYAIADSFITNPEAFAKDRDVAMNLVIRQMLDTAKELGIKQLIGITKDENTLTRVLKHGFIHTEHKIVINPLTSGQGV